MKSRLVCPKCRETLVLHRPAIESTRVKCRNCGTKFYAGKAEGAAEPVTPGAAHQSMHSTPSPGLGSPPNDQSADERSSHAETHEPTESVRSRHKTKVRVQPEPGPRRWWIHVSLAGLLVVSLAGMFFAQKAPPLPAAKAPVSNDANARFDSSKAEQMGILTNHDALLSSFEMPRPVALLGTWDLQEAGGGTVEFAAGGAFKIKATIVGDRPIEFTSRWFVIRTDNNTFELQIGMEPHHVGNHHMNVALQDDGTLRMTKYSYSAGLSVRERVFRKRA
jgi:hypothetical protein